MPGISGDDGPPDYEPGGIREVLLADYFAQLFDNSGEHVNQGTQRHPLRCSHADAPKKRSPISLANPHRTFRSDSPHRGLFLVF
jgi:hypothetical protein